MAIKLNDAKYDVKTTKVFNSGVAGAVHNCTIRIERKKKEDPDNAPLYKVIITDSAGGEINKGYFGLKPEASEAAQDFFVKEMKHLADMFGATLPETVETYLDLLNETMKACKNKQEGLIVAVAATYGNEKYPSKYIGIGSAFDIYQNAVEPYISPSALLVRPEPTPAEVQAAVDSIANAPANPTDDLPW